MRNSERVQAGLIELRRWVLDKKPLTVRELEDTNDTYNFKLRPNVLKLKIRM
jgi:hypothetical protein